MAWSYLGSGIATADSSGSVAFALPAGGVAGDLYVGFVASRGNAVFTVPDGWTILGTQQSSGNSTADAVGSIVSGVAAYIIHPGYTPTDTFTRVGGDVCYGQVFLYRSSLGAPELVLSSSETMAAASTSCSFTGVTTVAGNRLLVAGMFGARNCTWSSVRGSNYPVTGLSGATSASSTVADNAWTERGDGGTATGPDVSLGVFDTCDTSIGATGNIIATASLSARHAMILGAFKEPDGTIPSLSWDHANAASINDWKVTNNNTTAKRWDPATGDEYYAYIKGTTGHASGKRVFKVTVTTAPIAEGQCTIGVTNGAFTSAEIYPGSTQYGVGYRENGNVIFNGTSLAVIPTWTLGSVVYFLIDLDGKACWFNVGGTYYPGNPNTTAGYNLLTPTPIAGTVYPTYGLANYETASSLTIDGSASGLTLPTGFTAWTTSVTTASVTGLVATGSVGSVTVKEGARVSPTGLAATGSVGSVTAGAGISSPSPTGVSATGSVGTVTVAGPVSVSVQGVAATGGVGSIATAGQSVTLVTVRGLQAVGGTEYAAADYGSNSIVPTQWNPARKDTDLARMGYERLYYQWWQQGMNSWSFTSKNNEDMRVEVRAGDVLTIPGYTDPSTSERAEIVLNSPRCPDGNEIVIRYSMRLEATSPVINSPWFVVGQMHSNNGSSPPMELAFRGNDRLIVIMARGSSTSQVEMIGYTSPANLTRGKWYKIILWVKFDSAGFCRVYLDGAQVTNYSGDIGFSDQFEIYWRYGIYRNAVSQTQVVTYDNMALRYGGINQVNVASGRSCTASVGTVTVRFPAAQISTGLQATGSVGTVTVTVVSRITQSVTGVAATGSVGTALATSPATATVTGLRAITGSTGVNVVVATTANVVVGIGSGPSMISSVGSVTVTNPADGATPAVTSTALVGAVGEVVVDWQTNIEVTGVHANGLTGSTIIRGLGWATVVPTNVTIWTEITS